MNGQIYLQRDEWIGDQIDRKERKKGKKEGKKEERRKEGNWIKRK